MDLAQQVAAIDHRAQTDAGGFRHELPRADAQQQHHGIGRRAVGHPQELAEHHVHHTEHHQRLEHRPCDAEERALIPQPEVGLDQPTQHHPCIAVLGLQLLYQVHHGIHPINVRESAGRIWVPPPSETNRAANANLFMIEEPHHVKHFYSYAFPDRQQRSTTHSCNPHARSTGKFRAVIYD